MRADHWPADPVKLLPVNGGWAVGKPYVMHGEEIPRGFFTNLASVRWLMRQMRLFLRGQHDAEFTFHDYIYSEGTKLGWTRHRADKQLYADLVEKGATTSEAAVVYLAVRALGFRHWGPAHPNNRRKHGRPPHRR